MNSKELNNGNKLAYSSKYVKRASCSVKISIISRKDMLTFRLLCAHVSFVTRWLERYLEGGGGVSGGCKP